MAIILLVVAYFFFYCHPAYKAYQRVATTLAILALLSPISVDAAKPPSQMDDQNPEAEYPIMVMAFCFLSFLLFLAITILVNYEVLAAWCNGLGRRRRVFPRPLRFVPYPRQAMARAAWLAAQTCKYVHKQI